MRAATTACVLGLALASPGAALSAQDAPGEVRPHRRPPLRLEVTPSQSFYRQCVDWYVVEHRISGDTVVPRRRCDWALRR